MINSTSKGAGRPTISKAEPKKTRPLTIVPIKPITPQAIKVPTEAVLIRKRTVLLGKIFSKGTAMTKAKPKTTIEVAILSIIFGS